MLIFWSGLGILVPILTFFVLVLTQVLTDSLFGDGAYTAHGLPKLLALWGAAALMWLFGSLLARRPGRVLFDPQTGQQVLLKSRHTFFFIHVEYWAYILIAFGIVALFL
ncbi:MAG: hypothetical protein QOD32_1548 [Pyrinomonadaceae bacterium]|jgi:hypothetical protein|nr:hypothetical protein [Pyrinomonadaceae bacterium]